MSNSELGLRGHGSVPGAAEGPKAAVGGALKRALDVVVAATLMVGVSPLAAVVATLVAATLGRPVLFRQTRVGFDQREFVIFKFRTMTDAVDQHGRTLPDHARLTAVGRFLRRTSLDELPSLLNVIVGDMSLVGPRPLIPRYQPHYRAVERARFRARPGLTGLAQVRGRNRSQWDERLRNDVWYVENWSWGLDLSILWQTSWLVLSGRNVVDDVAIIMDDLDVERSRRCDEP